MDVFEFHFSVTPSADGLQPTLLTISVEVLAGSEAEARRIMNAALTIKRAEAFHEDGRFVKAVRCFHRDAARGRGEN